MNRDLRDKRDKRDKRRPLSVGTVRAFEVVGRHLSFRAAAQELFLTQSAVSRQIQALEAEVGMALFHRGTRHVELTAAGVVLREAVTPALERIDSTVRKLRAGSDRMVVNVSTFASMASLWLLPRLEAFHDQNPGCDIRVSSQDVLVDVADPEHDVILRHGGPHIVPPGAIRLFGDVLTPVISPWLFERVQRGDAPPLSQWGDLAWHTLIEQDDHDQRNFHTSATWRNWLAAQGHPQLEPRRWLYLNYTYQQTQAALAGQGITLARLAMVVEMIQRRELIEPFGALGRVEVPAAYWLAPTLAGQERPDVQTFMRWLLAQAALTREAIGETVADGRLGEHDA